VNAPRLPTCRLVTSSLRHFLARHAPSSDSGDGLVIQVLREVDLGEEEPAKGDHTRDRSSPGHRPDPEFQGLQIAEHVGRRRAHACDRPGIDSQRLSPFDVPNALNDGAVLMAVAYASATAAASGSRWSWLSETMQIFKWLFSRRYSLFRVVSHIQVFSMEA
jgi:hypothetical protein